MSAGSTADEILGEVAFDCRWSVFVRLDRLDDSSATTFRGELTCNAIVSLQSQLRPVCGQPMLRPDGRFTPMVRRADRTSGMRCMRTIPSVNAKFISMARCGRCVRVRPDLDSWRFTNTMRRNTGLCRMCAGIGLRSVVSGNRRSITAGRWRPRCMCTTLMKKPTP